eukprot:m.17705 g.17705  ORF g.17705 m.17705 type:complete len:503 (-) comp6087_c0_seq1:30-1538(-)
MFRSRLFVSQTVRPWLWSRHMFGSYVTLYTRGRLSLSMIPPPTSRKAAGHMIKTVLFDDEGNVTRASTSKEQLQETFNLSLRDLRMLDGSTLNKHPRIVPLKSCIIVSLHFSSRIIISRNQVIMIDPSSLSGEYLAQLILVSLREGKPRDGTKASLTDLDRVDKDSPFEFRALEAVLQYETIELDRRLRLIADSTRNVLQKLARNPTDTRLQRLLLLKPRLNAFGVEVKEFKEVVEDFADTAAYQKRIYLTPTVNKETDETAELLFDHFTYIAEEIENEAQQLSRNIRGTEEVLAIELDKARNRLLTFNLVGTTGAFITGTGAMMASLFGMNLEVEQVVASWEISAVQPFLAVSGAIFFSSATLGMMFYRSYVRVDRDLMQAVMGQTAVERIPGNTVHLRSAILELCKDKDLVTRDQFHEILSCANANIDKDEMDSLAQIFGTNGLVDMRTFLAALPEENFQNLRLRPLQDHMKVELDPSSEIITRYSPVLPASEAGFFDPQ